MTYEQALEKMYPGKEWVMRGGDVSTLVLLDGTPAPGVEEIETFIADEAAAKEAAKASALAKLEALGLTAAEAQAIAGI